MTDFTDPLAVFRAAVEVLNTEDWAAAAALVDPASLRGLVRQLRERLAPVVPSRTITAEEYMESDPGLPRVVAEHYAAEALRHADPTLRLQLELPGVTSVDELRALSPEEVLRHWLDGRSARRQIERLAADGRISPRAATMHESAGFSMYNYVAIGFLTDGDRLAHVLYRHDVNPELPWSGDMANWLANLPSDEQTLARDMWVSGHPSVAIVRRQPDGTWRLVVEYDFLNMGSLHIGGVRVQDEPDSDATGN
jgi:hypothetical protein